MTPTFYFKGSSYKNDSLTDRQKKHRERKYVRKQRLRKEKEAALEMEHRRVEVENAELERVKKSEKNQYSHQKSRRKAYKDVRHLQFGDKAASAAQAQLAEEQINLALSMTTRFARWSWKQKYNKAGTHDDAFQFFVKGLSGKTKTLLLPPTTTIDEVEMYLFGLGIHPLHDDTRFHYAGKDLQSNWTLADCKISKESTIYLILRNRGGAKSKKVRSLPFCSSLRTELFLLLSTFSNFSFPQMLCTEHFFLLPTSYIYSFSPPLPPSTSCVGTSKSGPKDGAKDEGTTWISMQSFIETFTRGFALSSNLLCEGDAKALSRLFYRSYDAGG